jgi:flavin-dependent dehydrogenase
VHEETSVVDSLVENGQVVGIVVRGKEGEERPVRARVVVDASGQDALLSRRLGTRRFDQKLKRAGLFAHYEGIRWPEGHQAGDILLPIDDGVWYWIIPFSDGSSSVGAVFDPALAKKEAWAVDLDSRLENLVTRSTRMRELLAGARRTSRAFGISDYSASSARLVGDGFLLVGDAATFLDPVFSTGVFLAMATGEHAAETIHKVLDRPGPVTAASLSRYEKYANRLFRRFRRFVYAFYDPVFFEAFCTKAPFDPMRAAVTTVLAGGVERISLRSRLWTELMFLGIAIDRFRRRLGLGVKEETPTAA